MTANTTANFRNRTLYHGDNLEFLRGINSETIDLVATDPPFNKGRDFHATPDSLAAGARFHDRWSWDDDVDGAWIDAIRDDWPALWQAIEAANVTWGRDMGAFLCYMGVRLLEMHRVLCDDGSLYLHCDPTASHYLKAMLDAIFGRRNFRNEIIWAYTGPGSPKMKQFNRKHDTILWYVKGSKWTFNRDVVRIPHKDGGPHAGGFKGAEIAPDDPSYGKKGKVPETWWTDIAIAARSSSQYLGYPTQKPVDLYRRIVLASSNPGDVVLDPFCGCATTLIAAEQEGRQWIGMDLWERALDVVEERLRKECGDKEQGKLWGGTVFTADTPPTRTDDGAIAAPPLKSKRKGVVRTPEPGPVLPRAEMLALLHERQEGKCAGCDRAYDDLRIWQIDHLNPRSAGGVNHHSNRCLLCPPCNGIKSDTMTLTALRQHNKREGLMAT